MTERCVGCYVVHGRRSMARHALERARGADVPVIPPPRGTARRASSGFAERTQATLCVWCNRGYGCEPRRR